MKKQDMIDTIRYRETQAYCKMLDAEEEFGKDSNDYLIESAKWSTLYDLCKELNIPT